MTWKAKKWHPHEVRAWVKLFDVDGNDGGFSRIRWIHGRISFPMTGYGWLSMHNIAYHNEDEGERQEIFAAVRGLYVVSVTKIPWGKDKDESQVRYRSFEERMIYACELMIAQMRARMQKQSGG
jgi:hypothetical protein